MIQQKLSDVLFDTADAILNKDFDGFESDYLALHSLIRRHKPKRFFEVGCNMGVGTKTIKNAIGIGEVFSLDLPTELAHQSLQSPISEGKGDSVGSRCNLPFTLLRGDSMTFNYQEIYPIDGWWIDGEHDYDHPFHEAKEAINSGAKLIIFHDSDIPCVYDAIVDAFATAQGRYDLVRIVDTRVSYAKLKNV